MATRVSAKGMKVYVELHFSDTWADGAHQTKPAAWASHGYTQLLTDVYNFTYDICTSLKAQGTTPAMISIGATMPSTAVGSTRPFAVACSSTSSVCRTTPSGTARSASLKANMNDVSARYNKPVVVAETAYPFTLSWEDEEGNVCCNKNMLLAGYAATPTGQAANLRDVLAAVRAVPNGRGLGVFYWEPTWTAVDGNGWSPDDASSGNSWET
ncbi:MAG TPA: glycosyl hydrolase 53 family protein [Microbacterium sp.]|nr:glycosyl hydrolase 53 family protein [Microbacterium sp.]HWI29901.1 glycosyl hydrolase 53 family protein [Microbacterium sp.]